MNAPVLRRFAKGFGANIGFQVSTVIIQIVGVPILLRAWGAAKYGEWLVLFAIPSYLSMTDLGFSQSAGNDMTQLMARGEHEEARAVFHTLVALVGAAVMIGLVVVTALAFTVPIAAWLKFSEMNAIAARSVLWLFAATVLIALPDWACHAAFRATGDYAFHMSLLTGTRLTQHAGVWIMALAGGQPTAAATMFFGTQVLGTAMSILLLAKRHKEFRFSVSSRRTSILRRLAAPAIANISFPLGQALNIQGMVVLVGAVLGPIAVVTFSTLRTLTRLVVQLVIAVSHAAEPELAAAYGLADKKLLQSIFIHSLRTAFWLALGAATPLLLLGRFIVVIWTRGRVLMNEPLFIWLLVSAIASVLWYGALALLRAANVHIRAALLYCGTTAAVVLLAGVLTTATRSVTYAGVALVIVDVVMVAFLMSGACSLLGSSVSMIVAQMVNPLPMLGFRRLRGGVASD